MTPKERVKPESTAEESPAWTGFKENRQTGIHAENGGELLSRSRFSEP